MKRYFGFTCSTDIERRVGLKGSKHQEGALFHLPLGILGLADNE